MPETWQQLQDKSISDSESCATFKLVFFRLNMDDIPCRLLYWKNMQQTLKHESYTATWYGSCKRCRGQYNMPIWLIPVPGDSSKPLKSLRYCFRVWRVNSGCKTHAQPLWFFHVCRLFSNLSLSCWSFPSETSSSSMRPESFHVDNHFASKNSQGDFQGWEATKRNYKTHHTIHVDKTRTFPLPVHFQTNPEIDVNEQIHRW